VGSRTKNGKTVHLIVALGKYRSLQFGRIVLLPTTRLLLSNAGVLQREH